jgi:protein-tyrosine phosphatase
MNTKIFTRLAATVLVGAVIATGAVGCAPSGATASSPAAASSTFKPVDATAPRLASVDNFRDVAGKDGYQVKGGKMRRGVVYRSNALTLTPADLATVDKLGISTDIDLRTPSEIKQTPDVLPAGVEYINVNFMGGDSAASGALPTTTADAVTMMQKANSSMAESETSQTSLRRVLTAILNSDGAVIIHCTAGKDRTGYVSAILQSIAGASTDTIYQDYLLTNDYTKARVDQTVAAMRAKQGDQAADAFAAVYGVQKSFLRAGLDAIKTKDGTVHDYLTKTIGLTDAQISALHDKLVEAD